MKTATILLAVLVLLSATACNNSVTNPDISLDLSPAYTGIVLDSANTQPVSGVRIDVGLVSLQSDAKGRFSLYGLKKGTYTVTATKTGYAPFIGTVTIEMSNVDQQIYLTK